MNIIEDKHLTITQLADKLDGDNTSTTFVLQRLTYNLVETRVSDASYSFISVEIKLYKIARKIDLLESKVKQLYDE